MSFKSLIAANLLSPDIRFVRASTKVSKPMANDLFALLLSTVVIAGGSYFIYKLLFEDDKDIERPIPYKQPGSASTDNVEEEDDESGYRLRIFFGSQSGTAEGFAFDMEKEGKQHGFGAKAIDLEDFSPEDLCNEQLVIFLVATYGEGEPTDNAAEFYEWLSAEDERTDDELSKVQFAVFGLGNSQYEFFNQMGRHFDKFLEQYGMSHVNPCESTNWLEINWFHFRYISCLDVTPFFILKSGGTRIFDRGEGDDDVGSIEDQFSEWKDALWPLLCEKYLGISEMSKAKFESSLSVQVLSEETVSAKYPIAKSIEFPYDLSNYSDTDINGERIDRKLYLPSRRKPYSDRIGICRMTSKHQLRQNTKDGSTFHLDFDLTFNKEYNSRNKVVQYETADNMGFIPRNDHKMVHKLCKKLGLNPNDIVRITPKDANATANYPFPEITSIKNLFLWYLDINAFPSLVLHF